MRRRIHARRGCQNGKPWLRANDPAMCDFLDELYGKSYDEAGNVVPP